MRDQGALKPKSRKPEKDQEMMSGGSFRHAAGKMDAAKGGYSDAASAIMESITSGLDKRQEPLDSKLDNKIDGYVDKVVKIRKTGRRQENRGGQHHGCSPEEKLQEEAKKPGRTPKRSRTMPTNTHQRSWMP